MALVGNVLTNSDWAYVKFCCSFPQSVNNYWDSPSWRVWTSSTQTNIRDPHPSHKKQKILLEWCLSSKNVEVTMKLTFCAYLPRCFILRGCHLAVSGCLASMDGWDGEGNVRDLIEVLSRHLPGGTEENHGNSLNSQFWDRDLPPTVPDKNVGHFRFTDLLIFYFVFLARSQNTLMNLGLITGTWANEI